MDWLRAGYPAGLPEKDYVPLVALLRRRLTDDELRAVSRLLSERGASLPTGSTSAPPSQVTSELPSEEDIERVRRYLAERGGETDVHV